MFPVRVSVGVGGSARSLWGYLTEQVWGTLFWGDTGLAEAPHGPGRGTPQAWRFFSWKPVA